MGLEPREIDLHGFIGADYEEPFDFWQNEANSIAYDFTGWTQFTLIIGPVTLTQGNGLTVAAGTITPSIARTRTTTLKPGTASYALSAIDPDGKLGFLMLGVFEWKAGNPR